MGGGSAGLHISLNETKRSYKFYSQMQLSQVEAEYLKLHVDRRVRRQAAEAEAEAGGSGSAAHVLAARMQPLETPPPLRASLAGGKYSGLHFVASPLRKWSLKDPSVRKKRNKKSTSLSVEVKKSLGEAGRPEWEDG